MTKPNDSYVVQILMLPLHSPPWDGHSLLKQPSAFDDQVPQTPLHFFHCCLILVCNLLIRCSDL